MNEEGVEIILEQSTPVCGEACGKESAGTSLPAQAANDVVLDELSPNTINQLEVEMKKIEDSSSAKKRKMV